MCTAAGRGAAEHDLRDATIIGGPGAGRRSKRSGKGNDKGKKKDENGKKAIRSRTEDCLYQHKTIPHSVGGSTPSSGSSSGSAGVGRVAGRRYWSRYTTESSPRSFMAVGSRINFRINGSLLPV